jgi:hypothetical protein
MSLGPTIHIFNSHIYILKIENIKYSNIRRINFILKKNRIKESINILTKMTNQIENGLFCLHIYIGRQGWPEDVT